MHRGLIAAGLLVVAGAANAGDIYVCKGQRGEKVYQNAPCATDAKQVGHSKYSDAMARPPAEDFNYSGSATAAPPAPSAYAAPAPDLAAEPPPNAPTSSGIGSSAYQRGEVRALRCVSATGAVYYARDACGSSTKTVGVAPDAWRNDQVRGIPGAVMVSPNEALNPMTGQIVQLEGAPSARPVVVRQQDQGTPVDADEACAAARRAADGKFSQRLDRRKRELCDDGRSLYDQAPGGGIP